jgi:hypothetical protein
MDSESYGRLPLGLKGKAALWTIGVADSGLGVQTSMSVFPD